MKFQRILTTAPQNRWSPAWVESLIEWRMTRAEIVDARDGSVIFSQDSVEVPSSWSDHAAAILAQKYFRKAGVPEDSEIVIEKGAPDWLCRSVPSMENSGFGGETSARQVLRRLVGCWCYWGWRGGYFDSEEDARVFYDELFYSLALQYWAPNSPQWFNTGLHWAYGIGEGSEQPGQWYVHDIAQLIETTATLKDVRRCSNPYERPQPHACFLTGTEDNLVEENGIMETWLTEARIFKYGSGSGVNVSPWRSKNELLSGGGVASGTMSWLTIGDKSAGAIHSGGTTRRAAKMVMLDDDHPELLDFINWKAREEHKAASMYVGSQLIRAFAEGNLHESLHHLIPDQTRARLREGFSAEVFGIGWEQEANRTIDGQNSNNSVRVSDALMRAVDDGAPWELRPRVSGETIAADPRYIWSELCRAAWACADPGIIFDDTVNAWNTCAADGRIRTTNPCAEFHHLDWSACNLASLRLTAFRLPGNTINVGLFQWICHLVTVVLDISVTMAAFPAPEFAVGAYNYRTLGLGYCDLGGLLMRMAVPYNSRDGRAIAAALTAVMTGVAYRTSAELAESLGPFPRWDSCRDDFMRVMRNHRRALLHDVNEWEGLNIPPYCVVWDDLPLLHRGLLDVALDEWNQVCDCLGAGFRNAQVSLVAPTGTISFVMDADTTGMEPEFSLVKLKNLAGGGHLRIANQGVEGALVSLGYDSHAREGILDHLRVHSTLDGCGDLRAEHFPVFACANELAPEAHIYMQAAIQPFLSGASSKTINMSESSTIEDVSRVYRLCHAFGIKAVALYRDNSKLAQPYQTKDEPAQVAQPEWNLGSSYPLVAEVTPIEIGPRPGLARGEREHLPWRVEEGYRQKVIIGQSDQELFWRTGNYPDGRLAELWITIAREGSTLRSFAECVAMSVSIGLQHGVPLRKYVDAFMGVSFEPNGAVEGHDEISFAASMVDLIARDLAITYLGRDDLRKSADYAAVSDPEKIVALSRAGLAIARGAKVTGDACPSCGGLLVQDGKCRTCTNCPYNEGCSA